MSYYTQADMARNESLRDRIAACAATQELPAMFHVEIGQFSNAPIEVIWADRNQWALASSPGWDTAWEYSLNMTRHVDPGPVDSVITDGMILAAVQQMINKQKAGGGGGE